MARQGRPIVEDDIGGGIKGERRQSVEPKQMRRPERIELTLGKVGLLPLFKDRTFSALTTPSGKPKPSPDVFLYAAETMKADPAKTFVIEDSVHGISGARAAGMRVIGFTGGAHTYPGHADRLTDAGAETVIRRWAELKPVLAALAEWSENA